jgi:hypothetical protein
LSSKVKIFIFMPSIDGKAYFLEGAKRGTERLERKKGGLANTI